MQARDSLTPDSFQINRDYSFLDYILGGCQLMFTVSPPPQRGPSLRAWPPRQQEGRGINCKKGFLRARGVSGPEERA